jgi:hypothetical protein
VEKKFSYMSEEIATDGGLTGRIIRFDEPIETKSSRRVSASLVCRTGQPKKPVGRKPNPLPLAPSVPDTAPRRVVPKNPLVPPDVPVSMDYGKEDTERALLCYNAALNRENDALRAYNEWLTNRVQVLEGRIYELTKELGNREQYGDNYR